MFDVASAIARSFFPSHFARRHGCRCTGTPKPSHREKATGLLYDFFAWLEGHFQSGFHLHDFIRERLEFTRSFVMHVRHEDAQFVFR